MYVLYFYVYFLFQLLLQYGADPELRDEDGHTPIMKAQERGDDWHKQCIEILEKPGTLDHTHTTL